ncbi:MAG: hypothetical protein ISS48_03805 [Candidatus Aenigmarchaeota archaeon]|nr:hypothetical protein [Candidatus Aenigmarchaeota archaeon]
MKIKVNYNTQSSEEIKEIILLTHLKNKQLIITDTDWKNYISASSTNNPTLVYESSRKLIDKFVEEYNPDQIFQIGTNITFSRENYLIDSRQTLIKIFFTQTDLIIPSNKQLALKSSFMNTPTLFEPSQETLEYLKPDVIYNFTSLTELDSLFKQKNPTPDYFILTNPSTEQSMFSYSLAKNKNAFVILSSGNPQQSKNKLVQEIGQFKLPEAYYFDKNLYLALIEVPYFSVQDPIDNAKQLISDTGYCDMNNNGYQDLSCGRLTGPPESLSYQIEYSKLYQIDKTALILASYNTPGKYWDVIIPGGTMPNVIKTEVELTLKGFTVTRLVEKRAEFDQIDFSVLEKLNNITKILEVLDAASYSSFFSQLLADINKIILVAKAGDIVMYSIYEFDWRDFWRSILNLSPQYPQHLPVFNEINLIKEIKNNQVVLYFSKGNETHWLIPINSTWYSTTYEVFDPSTLDSNSLFYYLKYSNSFGAKDRILNLGSLALITTSSDSYNIYSGQTAYHFFKEFDQTIGRALLETRNRNYELSQTRLNRNRTYEKEYYDTILLGDPSLSFDPGLDLKQSEDIEVRNGKYIITFPIQPDYYLVNYNGSSYIIFEDADDYFIENNKPIIPIYKKSFTLPTNSNIVDFSIELSNKTYDNIELPIIHPDPDFFDNQTFIGVFPEEIYWDFEIKMLDNTTTLNLLFSPVVYYSNNTAQVLDKISFSFTYDSMIEITGINATDALKGETEKIALEIFNNFDEDVEINLSLKIQTKSFEDILKKQLTLESGKNKFSIDYNNTDTLGDYSVSAVVVTDSEIAGPKYTHFKITKRSIFGKILYPFSRIFKINFSGFFKQTKTFKENYTIKKQGNKTILDYISLNMTIRIEQDDEKTLAEIKTKDGKLTIEQKFMTIKYNLLTPEGNLVMAKEKGQIKQEIKGNEKILKQTLNQIIDLYKNKAEELGITS